MALRNPGKRAVANWEALELQDQYLAVSWAARYLSKRKPPQLRVGHGVLRYGSGMRTRRSRAGAKHDFVPEPVLIVSVAKKLASKSAVLVRATGLIPPAIELRVPVQDRRILLAIPTDVQDDRLMPRAQGQRQGIRVRSTQGGGKIDGVACALVMNKSGRGPTYLLGCHHVILRSLVTQDAMPDPFSDIFTVPNGDIERGLGAATRPAVFGPDEIGSLDAALVRLSSEGDVLASSADFWVVQPEYWATDFEGVLLRLQQGATLYSRGNKRVQLQFRQHLYNQPVRYGSATVSIAEVFLCQAAASSRSIPRPGDSGAPVIATDGTLLGMHIAGSPEDRTSYMIPAYLLVEGPAFSPRITLARL